MCKSPLILALELSYLACILNDLTFHTTINNRDTFKVYLDIYLAVLTSKTVEFNYLTGLHLQTTIPSRPIGRKQ